ncbi:MAG TPA: hypothetical protein VFB33_01850 [Candidatus Binataceae bacterium]|jgi:hypothetical protein|nr:hypothetical protein [Candidatus Binataceae bacterium]
MEFDFSADERFARRMLRWLKQLPGDFQGLEVTVSAPGDGNMIGHRVWKASKNADLSTVAREIVEYSHGFPPGTKGRMKPVC